MSKCFLPLAFFIYASCAIAGPSQIDVIGLKPGISSIDDIRKADLDKSDDSSARLSIGGHRMLCFFSLIDEKLAKLACNTGEETSSGNRYTAASNFEVHDDLVKGFTKKFGSPYKVYTKPVMTRSGVSYTEEQVIWKDDKGNILILTSIADYVTSGFIYLISAAFDQKLEQQIAEDNASKKF